VNRGKSQHRSPDSLDLADRDRREYFRSTSSDPSQLSIIFVVRALNNCHLISFIEKDPGTYNLEAAGNGA
jgi:hypothetical protein